MKKMFTVNPKPVKNMIIKPDYSSVPNPYHLDAQIRFPARVVESKKHKPPKYKKQLFGEW